jgi:hypothetical protein
MSSHLRNRKTKPGKALSAADVVGWVGAGLLIIAYALLSFGVLDGQSLVYQLLNLLAAVGLVAVGWTHRAYPTVAVNVVWFIVAGVAILGILLNL